MTAPVDVTNAPVRHPGQTGTFYRPQLTNPNPGGGQTVYPGSGAPVQITLSGPWFAGAAPGLVAAMLDEMKYHVAAQALADVQLNLDRSIRRPTPYYETQIMLQNRVDDWVVHDRGIAYGPWLEGTSSRNHTTRFKGYASFRRALDSTSRKASSVVAAIAARFIGRMN